MYPSALKAACLLASSIVRPVPCVTVNGLSFSCNKTWYLPLKKIKLQDF